MLKKIFSKIEPFLPSQYKEIIGHFSYVFALRVVQQFISFVCFFFVLKHVSQEVIGHYHFVLSVVSLVSITSLPGMRNALMQAIARGQGGFFKIATRYCFLGAGIGSIILFVIAGYYYIWHNDLVMVTAFVIAGCLNPATNGLLSWKASYVGEERFRALSILDAAGTLIISVFLMFSVLFYTQSHILLLSIAFIVPALQNLLLTVREAQKYKESKDAESSLHSYGLTSSAYYILPTIAGEIDRLCVYNFISAADLALYNVAMKIPEAIKSLVKDVGNVVMPKFARMSGYTERLAKYLAFVSFVTLTAIIVFTFTFFPPIFHWLVPEEYYDALLYSQIFMCTIAINVHAILRERYIMSKNCIESFKKLTIMNSSIKIVSMPVLVFFFHLWGAVIAIIFQRLFNIVCAEIIIRKHHKISEN